MDTIINMSILLIMEVGSMLAIPAQTRDPLPTIQEDDTVRVYAAQSIEILRSNCLKDVPCIVFQGSEKLALSELFGHNDFWTGMRFYPSLSEGLFVEVRPQRGEPFGYYMTPKGYVPIVKGATSIRYAYPKKKKAVARQLIEKYQQLLPMKSKLVRYDHLPMKSTVQRPIACLLCPGSWKWMHVHFLVQMDSSQVKPIMYSVRTRRKKGTLIVSRSIPLLWSYDNSTLLGTAKPDSIADEMITKLIPKWNSMSDPERMRLLDDAMINIQN